MHQVFTFHNLKQMPITYFRYTVSKSLKAPACARLAAGVSVRLYRKRSFAMVAKYVYQSKMRLALKFLVKGAAQPRE
jgi:hypothetical protein